MNYITVFNKSIYDTQFRLIYFLNGRLISKSTLQFGMDQYKRLELPENAVGIVLTVMAYLSPEIQRLIYTENMEESETACYRVVNSGKTVFCTKVPCHNVF